MSAELFHQAEAQIHADKRAAWDRLQRESPDTAAMIADVARTFGTPEAVEIRFITETFRQGRFRGAKDYPDWKRAVDVARQKYLRGE